MKITSPYGSLKLLFPIYKRSGTSDLQYHRVTDNISHKILFKRMKDSKSIEFIYEKACYSKIIAIIKSIRKDLQSFTPNYSKCQSAKEIFHLHRRAKIDQNHFMARLGFFINENYKIFLRYAPDIAILPSAIRTFVDSPQPVFMPVNIWEGIVSANEWLEKGIDVEILGKIYPLYGVWPPTSQGYLGLLRKFLDNNEVKGTAVDLGCGSGVLGMILAKRGMSSFGVDSSFQAAKCSNLNAQKLGVDFTAVHGNAAEISIPFSDIIICNPPWIPAASSSILDAGNYDPDEQLLKAAFMQTKKLNSNGKFLLFHSDLAHRLGLQSKNRIEELCIQHGLVITNIYSVEFPVTFDINHPLKPYKDASHINLYEIKRI